MKTKAGIKDTIRSKVCFRNEKGGYFVYDERDRKRAGFRESCIYSRRLNGDEYRGEIHDISDNGMSFISKYPYLKGTTLYVTSEKSADKNPEKGKVVWSGFDGAFTSKQPKYRIGVKFSD